MASDKKQLPKNGDETTETTYDFDPKTGVTMKRRPSVKTVEFPGESKDSSTKMRNGYQLGRPSLVKKTGQYRVGYRGIKGSKRKGYFRDLYQTLIDIKWRWAALIFCLTFFFVYLLFAIFWYLLSYSHGDFDNLDNPAWSPCIIRMKSFADALLFSIETQTTIGYGTFYPDTKCGGSIPLVFIQITIGFLLETLLVGFILVKVARPKYRRYTLMFSDTMCICVEDGELCLQIRVGDIRKSHLIDASVYGIYVGEKISEEGFVYPLYQKQMEFEVNGMDDRMFLMWPMVISHKINEYSPLYDMQFEEMLANTFEIIIVLEGTIESTGEICQARTSYSSKDIQWGCRFSNLMDFDLETGQWRADFALFNQVDPSPTPKCSGKESAVIYRGTGIFGQEKAENLTRKAVSHYDIRLEKTPENFAI